MKNSIIITGSNGLIGSAFVEQLSTQYDFTPLDISNPTNPVDITNTHSVLSAIEHSDATAVVHFAAFTDVTAAWQQSNDMSGPVYKVNVVGTQNIVNACNQYDKHLIHISTAYVFDGTKEKPYTEDDAPNPIEWYGKTKAMAEQYVQEVANTWTILRIDQPFRPDRFVKADLAHKIIDQLKAGTLTPQFIDHYFGPTWIPDFVKIIDWSIRTKHTGLFHATSGESWNNYDFAVAVAEQLGSNLPVQKGYLEEYLKTQQRPYQKNTALDCTKLFALLDFKTKSIRDAITELQLD